MLDLTRCTARVLSGKASSSSSAAAVTGRIRAATVEKRRGITKILRFNVVDDRKKPVMRL
jgi:hypothetical protein